MTRRTVFSALLLGLAATAIAVAAEAPEPAKRRKLTQEDVLAMVKAGKGVEEILTAIRGSGARLPLTTAPAAELTKQKVPPAVILAMKGRPLTAADLRRLAPTELTPEAWKTLADLVGVEKRPIPVAEALELVFAGVPRDVVVMLQKGHKPVRPGEGPTTPRKPERVRSRALAEITKVKTPGVYPHVGKRFTIRYPKDWQLVRVIQNGQLSYVFTPEKGKTDPKDIEVGLTVWLVQLEDTSVVQGKDAVSILKHVLPLVQYEQPGMKPAGAIQKARIGKLDAATVTLHGEMRDKTGPYTLRGFVAEEADLIYVVETAAPKAKYPSLRPTFDKIARDSRFGWVRPPRLERSLEERHVTKPYKASVVSIVAESPGIRSTGTGFVITPSGYVLTNHHVVWNEKTDRPHAKLSVEWDDSLGLKSKPARLVRYHRTRSVYALQWGTDVALLKIPPGDYKPMPLSPLLDVEAGDRVVTMGFPQRGTLEGVSLTVSSGVVTRFNRGPDGQVVSVYTTAATAPGSSGGPCVSLVTGGAVGLNTFKPHVWSGPQTRRVDHLISYFGVVPIGECMRQFPLPTLLGLSHDGSELDFFETFGLSRYFTAARAYGAAQVLAGRAAKLRPDSADAHCQVGAAKMAANLQILGDLKSRAAREVLTEVVQACRRALACDPRHQDSLVLLAVVHQAANQLEAAFRYATQAVQACPEAWYCHATLSQVCFAQKKWDDAIRHALRAKEIASGLRADPCILAGSAYYAKGDLAAGLKEYQEAARIHPANLVARLGVGAYYERKGLTDRAIAAYRKILEDFRDNPVVLTRIGSVLCHAKRYEEATGMLQSARRRYIKLRQRPTPEVLLQLGRIYERATDEREQKLAYNMYSWLIYFHSRNPLVDDVHIRLAGMHAKAKRMGLASAHRKQAHKANPDHPELKRLGPAALAQPLSLDEIKFMVSVRYPLALAGMMIVDSGRSFDLTKEQADSLIQKDKMPAEIVRAILRARRPKRKVASAAPQWVGAWTARGVDPRTVSQWRMVMTFAKDGQFTRRRWINGTVAEEARGTYRYDTTTITGRSDRGATFRYPYKLEGPNVLILTMPKLGGKIRFTRQAPPRAGLRSPGPTGHRLAARRSPLPAVAARPG